MYSEARVPDDIAVRKATRAPPHDTDVRQAAEQTGARKHFGAEQRARNTTDSREPDTSRAVDGQSTRRGKCAI